MHVMILLSFGFLPQYKIPEEEKHKIMTRNCVAILKIKKIQKNNQLNIYFQTSHCFKFMHFETLDFSIFFNIKCYL